MIKYKTQEQIADMQKAGVISTLALKEVLKNVKVGISTLELDKIAEQVITSNGGQSGFKSVDDYKYTTCINVNAGIVHGLPNNYTLCKGDLVSIDLGASVNGLHSDLSYTLEVETNNESSFLNTGKIALEKAILQCKPGNTIGDISNAMQRVVEASGYSVSEQLVGHGIGLELHEDPYVPCYGRPHKGLKLVPNMALAIEVIYQKGDPDIVVLDDDWTIATADGSLSALFEKTVVITEKGHLVITDY